ncbi:MAG: roadblock/LC7 domain-containing protein [Frankia sp.]|nr:roadblock/LC7 domain-containing protein [Frankia sp.]
MSTTMDIDAVEAELAALRERVDGVTGSAVGSADGLLITHDSGDFRPEGLAAMAAVALGLGRRIGAEAGIGSLREVVTRADKGYVVVYAIRDTALLVVLGDENLALGRLHLHARFAIARLSELLSLRPFA